MSNGYKDIKKASDDEVKQIWLAWAVGGFLGGALMIWADGVPVLGVAVFWLWIVLGVAATIAAICGSWLALRKVDQARKSALR